MEYCFHFNNHTKTIPSYLAITIFIFLKSLVALDFIMMM